MTSTIEEKLKTFTGHYSLEDYPMLNESEKLLFEKAAVVDQQIRKIYRDRWVLDYLKLLTTEEQEIATYSKSRKGRYEKQMLKMLSRMSEEERSEFQLQRSQRRGFLHAEKKRLQKHWFEKLQEVIPAPQLQILAQADAVKKRLLKIEHQKRMEQLTPEEKVARAKVKAERRKRAKVKRQRGTTASPKGMSILKTNVDNKNEVEK